MSSEQRLAEVVTALETAGIRCLVMGGHAVRYYGLDRMTDDFDLHLAPDCFADVADRLTQSEWFRARKLLEVPSWRADNFRRFQIGVLPSGREEWLEFWKENHLLPSFADAYARRETGEYGGRTCDFLSLADLIHAKETEREKDWLDIQYLEEIQDSRLVAAVCDGTVPLVAALACLRSRRGLEKHLAAGNLEHATTVARGPHKGCKSHYRRGVAAIGPTVAACCVVYRANRRKPAPQSEERFAAASDAHRSSPPSLQV